MRVCVRSFARMSRRRLLVRVFMCDVCARARGVANVRSGEGRSDWIGLDWTGLIADHFLANFARVGSRRVECCSVFGLI